ncbi:MAG: hypothetical protein QOD99_2657 [Chthoniobacter sp.]|nr:hypothetical protein [Chthoniobacter sp.]
MASLLKPLEKMKSQLEIQRNRWLDPPSRWFRPPSRWLGPRSRWLGPRSHWLGPRNRLLGPRSHWLGPRSRWLKQKASPHFRGATREFRSGHMIDCLLAFLWRYLFTANPRLHAIRERDARALPPDTRGSYALFRRSIALSAPIRLRSRNPAKPSSATAPKTVLGSGTGVGVISKKPFSKSVWVAGL